MKAVRWNNADQDSAKIEQFYQVFASLSDISESFD